MNVVNNKEPRNTPNTRKGVVNRVFSRISWFVIICAALSSYAGAVEATSPVFGLSVKHDGVRQSAGAEMLTYSSQWDGGDGATVTIAENGAVIADGLSGEGTRPWSVQKTGEYTLTHTTYTNGIAGKVETATFVVPGPKLTFEYDGGPFVGGKVTINGNLDGWTIYYTLDGSTPTTEPLKYTGPFILSAAAALKVFAVSPSGMSTPIVENNYAVVDRARIENVRARQRLPWNGKVDIDFDVVGSAGVPYGVVLSVEDTVGGTNLSMRTVMTAEGIAIDPAGAKVTPGQYRWIWDAAADLPDGFECEAVSVNVDVLGEGAFAYFVRFNVNGGEGTMNDEMLVYGVEKALPANAFTRKGYAFAGWATSSDGEKVYEDKENVLNLSTTSGTVIDLYAVWKVDRAKVQLWEGGPYWATTNIGAEKPEDSGYYFWWGDTVGYKWENNKWVASDGSSSNFLFDSKNIPTVGKSNSTLQSEGWITAEGVLAPEHDAAHIHWGGDWRMPTKQELEDLCDKCDWTMKVMNGVYGLVVRGRGEYASNSVFLARSGYGFNSYLNDGNSLGSYYSNGRFWSSVPYEDVYRDCNESSCLYVSSGDYGEFHDRRMCSRYCGLSIRPVQDECTTVTFDACGGSSVNPIRVRIGLPIGELPPPMREGYTFTGWFTAAEGGEQVDVSTVVNGNVTYYAHWEQITDTHDKVQLWEGGPYWATTNIGAEKPEDYGYYFWWGDTVGYKRENNKWVASDGSNSDFSFSSGNTPTYNKSISTLQSEGWTTSENILAPEHDAANIHWGNGWRMPTEAELGALISNCDWTWTTQNGINGYIINGRGAYASNSIFLPAAGDGREALSYDAGSYGYYWQSVPQSDSDLDAWYLNFSSSEHCMYEGGYRPYGNSVRPVLGFTK